MKKTGGEDGRRLARVEREVQQTIAQFLISGFRVPLPGIVTVVRVQMPADLRTAKVYVSLLGDSKDQDRAVEILQERAFEIQKYLGEELRMRYCPKLTFYPDHVTQQVLKVERILQDLKNERAADGKADSGSSGEDAE